MPTGLAYVVVVIIWSTTPLAINWSIDGISPIAAVTLRMLIAVTLGYAWLRWQRIPMQWSAAAVKSYFIASMGIFFAMAMVYWAATRVASGLISVIFGLAPILSALMAQRLGLENRFSLLRWMAFSFSLAGLCLVFINALSIDSRSALGLVMLLLAVLIFSASGVWLKHHNVTLHPMVQTVGGVGCSVIFYLIAWMLWPGAALDLSNISPRAMLAISYLGIGGSLVGFACYFLILSKLAASTVALVTLVTPVFALMLGALLNGEWVSKTTIAGAFIIGGGLVLYYWGDQLQRRFYSH